MLLEFTYDGGLNLELVTINTDYIVSIQKPESNRYGCIIATTNGEKYPVKESYSDVVKMVSQTKSFKN